MIRYANEGMESKYNNKRINVIYVNYTVHITNQFFIYFETFVISIRLSIIFSCYATLVNVRINAIHF
jgi:hypothetical protein